ncbi:MAG: glycosyltransferase family 2 protein [Solirubrobacteraceae bacterium]
MTIGAVVVTYNRKELLRECLQAVQAQTHKVDHVLVVDNASDDGTPELVRAEFGDCDLLELATNEGAAGGFHEGMKAGLERGFEWLWVMDDDTIPEPDALERLLERLDDLDGLPEPSILASKIIWTDGRVHPMNPPGPALLDVDLFVRAVGRGLIPLRASTFPSMLVRADAIRRHRLPQKHFFLWSDDIDFSGRILRFEPGYMVPASVAVHKTETAHSPSDGGERFYYAVRNGLFILRGDALAPKEKVGHTLLILEQVRQFLLKNRFRPWALRVVLRGLRHGVLQPQRS